MLAVLDQLRRPSLAADAPDALPGDTSETAAQDSAA
jgi:hypothetical protein